MRALFLGLGYFLIFVLYVVAIGTWIVIPEELTFNVSFTGFLLFLTALLIIIDRERFSKYYRSGIFSKTVIATVFMFLLLCVFGMMNFIAFKFPYVSDFSALKLNSLTVKSVEVVKALDDEIKFTVFSKRSEFEGINRLIELYRFQNNKIVTDFVEAEVRPDLVKKYGIEKLPTIMVEFKDRRTFITDQQNQELSVTNALIKLSRSDAPVVYFTTGHGEPRLNDNSKIGISALKNKLQQLSFKVLPLELMKLGAVPKDASSLVVFGPTSGFNDGEIEAIEKYILAGGNIVIALDPNFKGDPSEKIRNLLKRHHVIINNDLVIDTLNHVSGSEGTVPLVKELNREHLITKEISSYVFYPLASSVGVAPNFSGRTFLLGSSTPFPASWAETDHKQILSGKITYNEKIDSVGPAPLTMAYEAINKTGSVTRIVALGTSQLVRNQYESFVGNNTLVINAISWTSLDGQIDSFNLPFEESEPIFISTTEVSTVFYVVVILLPVLMFACAFIVYRRNRRL